MKNGRDMTDYERELMERGVSSHLWLRPIKVYPYIKILPKRPVSPYAKFDKFNHKKKRK